MRLRGPCINIIGGIRKKTREKKRTRAESEKGKLAMH